MPVPVLAPVLVPVKQEEASHEDPQDPVKLPYTCRGAHAHRATHDCLAHLPPPPFGRALERVGGVQGLQRRAPLCQPASMARKRNGSYSWCVRTRHGGRCAGAGVLCCAQRLHTQLPQGSGSRRTCSHPQAKVGWWWGPFCCYCRCCWACCRAQPLQPLLPLLASVPAASTPRPPPLAAWPPSPRLAALGSRGLQGSGASGRCVCCTPCTEGC